MNLLTIELEPPAIIELQPSQRMTLWLGTWSTPSVTGPAKVELVFEPHEVQKEHRIFMDHQRNTYALWEGVWYHARLFNVATNVERYLADKAKRGPAEREALARVLPFHLCVHAGQIRATVSRLNTARPTTSSARDGCKYISRAHKKLLQDLALLMPSLHSKCEWQLLERLKSEDSPALAA